ERPCPNARRPAPRRARPPLAVPAIRPAAQGREKRGGPSPAAGATGIMRIDGSSLPRADFTPRPKRRTPTRRGRPPSLLTSAVLLALAAGAAFLALRPAAAPNLSEAAQRLRERLPDADPALLTRTAETFGQAAEQVADRHGVEGLRVLDTFGAEAFFCWE